MDYVTQKETSTTAGQPKQTHHLTLEAFARWCGMAPDKEIGAATTKFLVDRTLTTVLPPPPPLPPTISQEPSYTQTERRLGIEERKLALQQGHLQLQQGHLQLKRDTLDYFDHAVEVYKKHDMDERAMLNLRGEMDMQCVQFTGTHRLAIEGEDPKPTPMPISISNWLHTTGRPPMNTPTIVRFGQVVARLYREKHGGATPPKHRQFVDGGVRDVNSYTSEDFELLEAAYREFMKK